MKSTRSFRLWPWLLFISIFLASLAFFLYERAMKEAVATGTVQHLKSREDSAKVA